MSPENDEKNKQEGKKPEEKGKGEEKYTKVKPKDLLPLGTAYDEYQQPPPSKFGGMSVAGIIISLVVSLVVAYGMISIVGVTHSAYVTDITRLENDLVAQRQADTSLSNQIGGVQDSLSDYATKSDLGDYATVSSVEDLQALPDTVDTAIVAMNNKVNATIANITSNSLEFWLTEDNTTDLRLHILSDRNMTFMAEITLYYTDPQPAGDDLETALKDFNTTRDYIPALVWNGTGWQYNTVTFHAPKTGLFEVAANKEYTTYILNKYLLGCDAVSVKLIPCLEITGGGGGGGGS